MHLLQSRRPPDTVFKCELSVFRKERSAKSKQDQVWTQLYQSSRRGGRPSQASSPDSKNADLDCGPLPLAGQTATERYRHTGEHRLGGLGHPPDPEKTLGIRKCGGRQREGSGGPKIRLDLLTKKSQLWFMHTTDVKSTDPMYFR